MKTEIKNENFIDIFLSFAISNNTDTKKIGENLLSDFDRIRLKGDTFLEGINRDKIVFGKGFLTGITPKIVSDKFPNISEPVKGYGRTKKFNMKISSKGIAFSMKQENKGHRIKNSELSNQMNMIQFLPESKYSPIDLAKDVVFIETFNQQLNKLLKCEPVNIFVPVIKDDEIYIRTVIDFLEYDYPLKKRIELYKINPQLDEFIFQNNLRNSLFGFKYGTPELEKLQKEAQILFEKMTK